jgi:drug/metabolite transporter (DMT)-like permease
MDWINTAILSASISGVVNIFHSHLLTKRLPGLRSMLLLAVIFNFIYGFIALALFPLSKDVTIWPLLTAIAYASLRAVAIMIMLNSLKKEEVSNVIPVAYTYPIFVALLAVPILSETLGYLEWLAILCVVLGAIVISIRQADSGSTNLNIKLLFMLLGSSLLFAIADIAAKYTLRYMSFWNMFWINVFWMYGIFLLISVRRDVIKQIFTIKRIKSTMALIALNETLVPISSVLLLWALKRGPVSLVSTILSSRPMFVLLFAIILSRLFPKFLEWRATKKILILRLIGTIMVVGGIIIVQLV